MDPDTVIKVENVSKKFTRSIKRSMLYGTSDIAKSMLGIKPETSKLRKGEFWSLRNISFELKKGGGLGIIGSNGSGKSTLLRIINGIFPPDTGKVTIKGKIGALIAVGAGFHPHMTGRENIALNGTILGMQKEKLEKEFDNILAFADIGEFIDAPVSTYSSGMTVRLGFSIAIHSDPEILLADEVLAVGDLQFALKCHKKISEYRQKGGSIILVSHGMNQIRNVCENVIWIDNGVIREAGEVNTICDHFENFMFKKDKNDPASIGTHITNDPDTLITDVKFFDNKENIQTEFNVGSYFKARVYYNLKREVKAPMFTFGIANVENVSVIVSFSNQHIDTSETILKGEGFFDFIVPKLYLKPGNYRCTVTLTEGNLENVLDWHEKNFLFTIYADKPMTHGLLQMPTEWDIKK